MDHHDPAAKIREADLLPIERGEPEFGRPVPFRDDLAAALPLHGGITRDEENDCENDDDEKGYLLGAAAFCHNAFSVLLRRKYPVAAKGIIRCILFRSKGKNGGGMASVTGIL